MSPSMITCLFGCRYWASRSRSASEIGFAFFESTPLRTSERVTTKLVDNLQLFLFRSISLEKQYLAAF